MRNAGGARVAPAHTCRNVRRIVLLSTLAPSLLLGQPGPAVPAEPAPSDTTRIDASRAAIVGGIVAVSIATIHLYQQSGWWKNNRAPFHFQEDLKYGLHVDKLGHMYGGTVLTFVLDRSLRWANFSDDAALMWGATGALLFQTYVEIEDGFSTWGFDRVDFASDVMGSVYPVAQYHVPFLRNFNFKFSYHPSNLINEPGGVGFKGQKHIMFDDYEGQTIWLSLRVKDLLPEPVASYWPGWLCLAAGYGARNIATSNPYRVYFVGLDLDMTRVIPRDTAFLRLLGDALNFIHMPMPAVKVSPNAVWYMLYF